MLNTTTALCHSEERSDEESRFLDLKRQRNNEILRSLWSLRMTIQATAVVVLIVGVDFSILTRAAVEQTALQVINVRKVPPAPALQAGAARVQ